MPTPTLDKTMSKVRIFRGAGHLCLIRHKADGSNSTDPKDIYTSDRSVVDNITTNFSRTTNDMNDGNSMWPAGTYLEGVTATAVPTLNTVDMDLYCFVTGAEKVVEENAPMYRTSVEKTVEAATGSGATGGVIHMGGKLKQGELLVVRGQYSGEDYTIGDAVPAAAGQVKVDYATGDITFHTDDVGKIVYVSCCFEVPEKVSYKLPAVPRNDTFTVIITGENYDKDEVDKMWDSYAIDCAKVTGDIANPPRQKTPAGWTPTFSIGKPRPGKQAIDWGMAKPVGE